MATEASPSSSKKYDVFLSFRGEDTRNQFTGHLYHALNQKGIYTFRDDKELKKGKDISPELLKAIEESRFAVVILSEDYASSSWCLEELAKIVECKEVMRILPVFYHVEPTDVRKQKRKYDKAFEKHEQVFQDNLGKVKRWKEALSEVASISGWDVKGRFEADVIQEIVNEILQVLNKTLPVGNNSLVAMDSRIKKVDMLLNIELDDIRTLGVWGMGGIGKTTIAREVFHKIHVKFEVFCFIANVREEFEKNGIAHLQDLLCKTMVDKEGNIHNYDMGFNALRKILKSKRVLIVLDDVDRLEQIEALVGNAKDQHDWLGPGSRVIVTTRDKHLLKTYGEEHIHEVDKLNHDESLQLLCQKAFKKDCIVDEFIVLSKNVVEYADGHPLALIVLGSFLFERSVEEWLDTLAKLKENPDKNILLTLRISFDGLDDNEKKIFLDIACFFKGEEEYRVKKILEGCGFNSIIGVNLLIEKSLITIVGDRLWMHELLEELGRDIVRRESPELGNRSRLWSNDDTQDVLVNNTGTKTVQGMFLNLHENEELHLSVDPFLKMQKLRLLKIRNVYFNPQCVGYLSNELRLLEWHGYPQISMPSSFNPNKLVELNMSSSRIERLWKETTLPLKKLLLINLSNCEYLKQTPDLSRVPNLERLILKGCKRLSEVHPAIGVLKRLVLLNLKGCKSLKSLPHGIHLKSLKTFILSGCTKLNKFPEIKGNMDDLCELHLDGTGIKELPISIKRLTNLVLLNLKGCQNLLSLPNDICSLRLLKTLDLSGCLGLEELPENLGSLEQLEDFDAGSTAIKEAPSSILLLKNLKRLCFANCRGVANRSWKSFFCRWFLLREESNSFQLPSSFYVFRSLTSLNLRRCYLQEGAIPEDIGCLSSLRHLNLGENNFMSLPKSISRLSNLVTLLLGNCSKLESLPILPLRLKFVEAYGCPLLNRSNTQTTVWTSVEGLCMIFYQKPKVAEQAHFNYLTSDVIQNLMCQGTIVHFWFPCSRIPEWFKHWSNGSSITIQLPLGDCSDRWMGIFLFVFFVIEKHDDFDESWDLKEFSCCFHTDEVLVGNFPLVNSSEHLEVGSYGVCLYLPRICIRASISTTRPSRFAASISTTRPDIEVKMCGMHVLLIPELSKLIQKFLDLREEHSVPWRQHMRHILQEAREREILRDVLQWLCNHQQRQDWSSGSSSSSVKHGCKSTDSTNQQRRDLQSLFSTLVQECHANNTSFVFQFPLKAIRTWFVHQSVGSMVYCELPPNLFDEKQWGGFCLYASLTWPPSSLLDNYNLDSETPRLYVELYSYGSRTSHITTFSFPFEHQFLLFNVPRRHFREDLNLCWEVSASICTNIPDVEIEMCGIRVAYNQDLRNVVEMITDIALSDTDEQSPQFYFQEIDSSFSSAEETFIRSSYSSESFREHKSLQEFLSSTQLVDKLVSTAYERNFVPSDPIGDSAFRFIELQITPAKTALYENDSIKWHKRLGDSLKHLFVFDIPIHLNLHGRIISVLRPFNPFSKYSLCFPRKEILEGFEDTQVCKMYREIKLPPNLITDNNWMGLSVCASFSVQEHPFAFIDDKDAEFSTIDLLYHMDDDQGNCLNPSNSIRIRKEKFKWFYVRGFIWLMYIPSSLLLPQLNGVSHIYISFYHECPALTVQKISARLLYHQDVEEFTQSITECISSLYDNMDLIRQFVEDENRTSFSFHEDVTETRENDKDTTEEDLKEPTCPGKSGLDFDRDIMYNSCFPPTQILEWFSHHNTSGPSVKIQLPSNIYSDDNWVGLALCAYFSNLEHPFTFDPESPHFYLNCHLETGLKSLYCYEISNDEFNRSRNNGEFMWLSYIPRSWFADKLNDYCRLIEASFESSRQGLWVQKCGLRLLYQHDEEEFKHTISHCITSFSDNTEDPISHIKVQNEKSSKQYEAESTKSGSLVHRPQHEGFPSNLNPMDRGKQILQ